MAMGRASVYLVQELNVGTVRTVRLVAVDEISL